MSGEQILLVLAFLQDHAAPNIYNLSFLFLRRKIPFLTTLACYFEEAKTN